MQRHTDSHLMRLVQGPQAEAAAAEEEGRRPACVSSRLRSHTHCNPFLSRLCPRKAACSRLSMHGALPLVLAAVSCSQSWGGRSSFAGLLPLPLTAPGPGIHAAPLQCVQRAGVIRALLQVQHAAGPALPGAGGHQLHQLQHQEQGEWKTRPAPTVNRSISAVWGRGGLLPHKQHA